MGVLVVFVCPLLLSADEAAVRKMIGAYAEAFNQRQIDAVAGFWTENGVHVDHETGERTEGRDAIRDDIAVVFEERPDTRIFGSVDQVRMIKPDVATVKGNVTVTSSDADPSETDFSAIAVSQDGKWMISSIEERPVEVAQSASDALEELAWLEGQWVDQAESARVDTVFRWSPSRTFLIRSYVVTGEEGATTEGTQVIGWDPRSGDIRSWSFSSTGAFGDGTWSRNGDDWLVRSSQTLADGRAASGTFVITRNGDDEMTMKLVGHSIEGEPQPTGAGVTAKRVTEEPAVDDTANQQ